MKKPIKIGLIAGTLNSGGAERMMVQLAKGFIKENHQVIFFLVNQTGPFLKELPQDITVINLNAKFGVKSAVFSIRKEIRKHRPDVLISTQPHINAIVNLLFKFLKNKPHLLLREANTPSVNFNYVPTYQKFFYKWGYKGADHYIAVSEGVRTNMIDFYELNPKNVTTIFNPVVDKSLKQRSKLKTDHRWFKDIDDVPIIISMGRVVPQKDQLLLLKAFSEVKKKVDARLLIIGENNLDPQYKQLLLSTIKKNNLQSSVDMIGFIANPFPYLRNASLFVLSSRFEGLPGSLIQAMACGCPVVSTDCPSGPLEILENGKYGKLVTVGDERELAEAMIYSLKHPVPKEELIKRADNFSSGQAVSQYLQLIHKLKK